MSVNFFFHHRQHVEGVPHCIEAENHWQLLETSPNIQAIYCHHYVKEGKL